MSPSRKQHTSTSTFGVSGRRENHDARLYYDRALVQAEITDSVDVSPIAPGLRSGLFHQSSDDMRPVPDNCVALMITSPSYHVGKDYDSDVSFDEYLTGLERVFTETYRVLEPGGRACINVANLGRRPYIRLNDLVASMMFDIGFHNRGEIVWVKAAGASGSMAFGSYLKATNPTLRDLHEYVLVFCKDRFDRAIHPKDRKRMGLPHESTITKEDFLDSTLSVWKINPESAKRVGHPAPFPIELPRRLIELYSFRNDIVLDPFVGSGTTAVAAVQTGRRYLGFDTDASYLERARERIAGAVPPAVEE